MTLWEHLAELRSRLIKSVVAVAAGAVLAWMFYDRIFDFLLHPYRDINPDAKLYVTSPLQGFGTRLQVCTWGGITFAMPVILWQIWRFVTPGLYPNEKRYAVPFTLSAIVLFLFGAAIAYLTLNPALEFLIDVGGSNFEQIFSPDSYVKLIAFMMLAFGAGFEFPVLLVALQIAGVLAPSQLGSWRRHAIVVIAAVAAVITPSGDPVSMLALAVPMYLFYEVSILIGWIFSRRKHRSRFG
ncbi:MAG: twin-arginine translocase subunit TatC [Acidimicrobiales bacterium]|nr:twin-arginine translocase subunit TatC [Acidimicrobiales bacterium]